MIFEIRLKVPLSKGERQQGSVGWARADLADYWRRLSAGFGAREE